jgi:uncharacterized protein YciI
VKYVVFYQSAPNVAVNARAHFAAHRAHWTEFVEAGELELIGTFADPQADGSMAVFKTREAAEAFVKDDPFVLNGVVDSWRILGWNEALTRDPAPADAP